MIDLTQKSLPNTIEVNGRLFSIYTDFRIWMRFEISLMEHRNAKEIPVDYLFKNEKPVYCNVRDLLAFSRPRRDIPRPVRGTSDEIILDYKQDADLIYAAFLQQYGIDLMDVEELHWHKFLAMIHGLKGTKLDEVMGYRCYTKQRDKTIDPYEEMKEAWRLERPLDEEEQAELDEFNRLFGGGE